MEENKKARVLRWILTPVCVLLVTAGVIAALCLQPSSPAANEPATEAVLTHFSDDLGTESALKFTTITVGRESLSQGSLVLVNDDHKWPFPQSGLVNVYRRASGDYQLSSSKLLLQKDVMDPLNEMLASFQKITGFGELMVSECWRSESDQGALYEGAMESTGERLAAKPGYSEYHTGFALSLSRYTAGGTVMDFTGEDESGWLLRNCARYGFIIRCPQGKEKITGYPYQPWHLRYVGRPHAYLMGLKNYCLEEYLEYVSHYTFGGNHIQITDNENQSYEIYYVPFTGDTTSVPVPVEKEYVLSGDNVGGVVVTVKL